MEILNKIVEVIGSFSITLFAIIIAFLFVVQTHLRIKKKPEGKITIYIEKKPSKEGMSKPFINKLLAYITNSTSK